MQPCSQQFGHALLRITGESEREEQPFTIDGRRWCFVLVVGAITSSAGVYYAFFSSYFLALAGLAAAWSSGQIRHLLRAMAVVGIRSVRTTCPTWTSPPIRSGRVPARTGWT